jgi:hypothetical protein
MRLATRRRALSDLKRTAIEEKLKAAEPPMLAAWRLNERLAA